MYELELTIYNGTTAAFGQCHLLEENLWIYLFFFLVLSFSFILLTFYGSRAQIFNVFKERGKWDCAGQRRMLLSLLVCFGEVPLQIYLYLTLPLPYLIYLIRLTLRLIA